MIRSIRSRLDYYGASSDPSRAFAYDVAAQGVPNFRSVRSIEELRRRPYALQTGVGNLRPVGIGQPYSVGMGRPSIELADIGENAALPTRQETQENQFWAGQGIDTEHEEFQRQQIRNPLWRAERH